MPRFRRKPTEIEAMQFDGSEASAADAREFSDGAFRFLTRDGRIYASVETPNGGVLVDPGDWIVRGTAPGDFYPVKPEVFAATYEPMEG